MCNVTGTMTFGLEASIDNGATWYPVRNPFNTTLAAYGGNFLVGNHAISIPVAGLPYVRVTFANASGGALAFTVDAYPYNR
jgi:hypothetical protein